MSSESIARLLIAFTFIYHGLVPKLLFVSPMERAMIEAHGSSFPFAWVSVFAGVAEIILGIILLTFRNSIWPIILAIMILIVLLIDVAIFYPSALTEAFNPVTTNLAVIGLCLIVLNEQKGRITR